MSGADAPPVAPHRKGVHHIGGGSRRHSWQRRDIPLDEAAVAAVPSFQLPMPDTAAFAMQRDLPIAMYLPNPFDYSWQVRGREGGYIG